MNKTSKFNVLMSLERKVWPARMTQRQRNQTRTQLKKAAKEALVYASSIMKHAKGEPARQALAHAVDCLSIVDPLDQQSKVLLRVCYEQAAIIHKNMQFEQGRENLKRTMNLQAIQNSNELLLDFDHEAGLFQLRPEDEKIFNYDLKFPLSKINGVLFSFNNQETAQSLLSKIKSYQMTILVAGLLFLLTLSVFLAEYFWVTDQWMSNITNILLSATFLCPLIMIYFKNPQREIVMEFEENLRKEIDDVNNRFEKQQLNIRIEFLQTNQLRVFKLEPQATGQCFFSTAFS